MIRIVKDVHMQKNALQNEKECSKRTFFFLIYLFSLCETQLVGMEFPHHFHLAYL